MKRIFLMGLLALALPMAAFAGSVGVDFSNQGGTLTGSSSGLVLTGSELIGVEGFNGLGPINGALGAVNFSTGTYVSTQGSGLNSIATFNGGGTFQILSNGLFGLPSGTIFNGSFSGPVSLTLEAISANGGDTYLLSGNVSGTWYNGTAVKGFTSQVYIFTGKNGWMGSSTLGSGDTIITTVPEPGTLGLLGTGLVGLAGIVRRKLKA